MNSSESTNSSKESSGDYYLYDYDHLIFRDALTPKIVAWIIPILVVMALFGNTLIIIIMNKPVNRVLTCSVFFTALAVSDTLFVLQISVERWLAIALSIDFYSSTTPSIVAMLKTIATYSNIHISTWLLVALMVERLLCVVIPHKVKLLLSINTARLIVIGVCAGTILLNSLFIGISLRVVFIKDIGIVLFSSFPYGADIFTWYDITYGFVLPFLLITSGTIMIVVSLYRRNIQATSSSSDRAMSATRNLLVANISFLITYCPEKLFNIIVTYDNIEFTKHHDRLYHVFLLMADANAALNFFLYVLSGSRFRADVLELFKKPRTPQATPRTSTKLTPLGTGTG